MHAYAEFDLCFQNVSVACNAFQAFKKALVGQESNQLDSRSKEGSHSDGVCFVDAEFREIARHFKLSLKTSIPEVKSFHLVSCGVCFFCDKPSLISIPETEYDYICLSCDRGYWSGGPEYDELRIDIKIEKTGTSLEIET